MFAFDADLTTDEPLGDEFNVGAHGVTFTTSTGPAFTVEVAPPAATIEIGRVVQLTATITDDNGDVVNDIVQWSSDATGIAAVDASGLVTGVGLGNTTIRATFSGAEGTATIAVVDPLHFVSIDASGPMPFTCALTLAREVYCWGLSTPGVNGVNFLGRGIEGDNPDNDLPGLVVGDHEFASVSVGGIVCGVDTSGTARCWGGTIFSGVGAGSFQPASVPTSVAGNLNFISTDGGNRHACGLVVGGAAYCWGSGSAGRLGTGNDERSAVPVPVVDGHVFTSLTAGGLYTCGITPGGDAYCWGFGLQGQLGDGVAYGVDVPETSNPRPTLVAGGLQWASLSGGDQHTCGVTTTGVGYCWGEGSFGRVGTGAESTNVPEPVAGGLAFSSISAGAFHSCGVTTGGDAYCWGRNDGANEGALGHGLIGGSAVPVAVAGGLEFAAVTTGENHSCGITTNGVAYCWGRNGFGELGDGTEGAVVRSFVPVLVGSPPSS